MSPRFGLELIITFEQLIFQTSKKFSYDKNLLRHLNIKMNVDLSQFWF